ncbi:Chloramphenicol phosphotransferase-like protein [compost metagenome]
MHCPPEELARRERERGDRAIGQALKQLEIVHKEEVYDVEVDTYVDSAEHCAEQIVQQAMKQAGRIS